MTSDNGVPATPSRSLSGCRGNLPTPANAASVGRLEAIKARVEYASPGPWRTLTNLSFGPWADGDTVPRLPNGQPVLSGNWKEVCSNAAFIARSRQDVPWLVGEVERLREENARYFMGLAQIDYAGTPDRKTIEAILHDALNASGTGGTVAASDLPDGPVER